MSRQRHLIQAAHLGFKRIEDELNRDPDPHHSKKTLKPQFVACQGVLRVIQSSEMIGKNTLPGFDHLARIASIDRGRHFPFLVVMHSGGVRVPSLSGPISSMPWRFGRGH